MKIWSCRELYEALDVSQIFKVEGDLPRFNSKDIKPEDFFIALRGKTDGHEYVLDALQKGASFAIVDHLPSNYKGFSPKNKNQLLLVKDTKIALHELAQYRRRQLHSNCVFIGVTGSVGKTSTKEIIARMLKSFGMTYGSYQNFNNHIGLRLNLASVDRKAQYVVMEVGMNHKNEITPLSKLLKPNISVITNVFDVHRENFNSTQEIAEAKAEIFAGLKKNTVAILPKDNQFYDFLVEKFKSMNGETYYSFGEDKSSTCFLKNYQINNDKAFLKYELFGEDISLQTEAIGKHQALNICIALLIAKILSLDMNIVIKALEETSPILGRGKKIDVNKHEKNFTIIHDAYNSSPPSVKAALEHLKSIEHDKKILILADMLELGEKSVQYHEELLKYVINAKPYKIITVGPIMLHLHNKLSNINNRNFLVKYFPSYEELSNEIEGIIEEKCLAFFKGSKGTKLYTVVEELLKV